MNSLETLGTQINTPLARAFQQIVTAGWGNLSDGNVEAPTGHFSVIIIEPAELKELIEAVFDDYEGEPVIYPGDYVLVEDSDGNAQLTEYLTGAAAIQAFTMLSAEFEKWEQE